MEERTVLDLRRRTPHFQDLWLSDCGVSPGRPDTRCDSAAYCLCFVTNGRGRFEIDGTSYPLSRGDGLLVKPHERLAFPMEAQESLAYFWVRFSGEKAETCLQLAGLESNSAAFRCAGVDELLEQARELLALEAPGPENELLLQAALFRFFAQLAHGCFPASDGIKGSRDNLYVQKAIAYIQENYAAGITVADVAHHVSLNRSYLTTLFQRTVEFSPQDYLMYYRMARAKERLLQTDDTIARIALSCGYADPQVFSKAFKQQVGMTPMNFRRSERAAKTPDPIDDSTPSS